MTRNWTLALATAALLLPGAASAQHEGHQMPATDDDRLALAQCAQVQPVVAKILDGAAARLEEARQDNDPAQLRAAIDHLGDALRNLRAQLTPCTTLPAPDPHAGHTESAAKPDDPHAGHTMPAAKPAAPAKPPPPDRIDPR